MASSGPVAEGYGDGAPHRAPAASERYILQGEVRSVHGREATVLAEVTLVSRDVRAGEIIAVPVFWTGETFVAVQSEEN